jgi:putative transcriptional regulator
MLLDRAIQNRLKVLLAEKELRENRKLTYRTVAKETGLAIDTLTAYMKQRVNCFDKSTLETLCQYLSCDVGDLLKYSADDPKPNQKPPGSRAFLSCYKISIVAS